VLSNAEKRRKYDQLSNSYFDWQNRDAAGSQGFDWSQWMGSPGGVRVEVNNLGDIGDMFGGGFGSSAFSDFFNSIFGAAGAGPSARAAGDPRTTAGRPGSRYSGRIRGRNVEQPVTISLQEAYQGTTRSFEREGRKIEVKIPPGSTNGTKIRVSGMGTPGAGKAGDFYLNIRVAPHPEFKLENRDLSVEVPVDLYTAVLGGEIQVNTLTRPIMLSIPAGTQSGRTFRIRGHGLPALKSDEPDGDLMVKISVEIPEKLSQEEKELFEQLASLGKK